MIQFMLLIVGIICICFGWDFERTVDVILFILGVICVSMACGSVFLDALE